MEEEGQSQNKKYNCSKYNRCLVVLRTERWEWGRITVSTLSGTVNPAEVAWKCLCFSRLVLIASIIRL